jgi:hypothetical protein
MNSSAVKQVALLIWIGSLGLASAQRIAPPEAQKTLAATLGMYVFPAQGQAVDQQSKDEVECYGWAVQNTGTDPFELAKQQDQAKQQGAQPKQAAAATGGGQVVAGAAVGAVVGEVASDDAGKGAAYGGAAGLLRARRKAAEARSAATARAEQQGQQAQQSQQAAAQQVEGFRKAFSVCLEAKHYLVKY